MPAADRVRVSVNQPRIGVVGTGSWGRNLVRNFSSLGALGALCDVNGDTLNTLSAEFPEANTHHDLVAMLADPSVEAVAIATPSTSHAPLAKQVLYSERPVFVEKPLCTDLAQAQELKVIVDAKRLLLMVGHLLLYHPAFVALKQFVRSGRLGALRYIYSHRLDYRDVRGPDDALWDFAPHDVSMLLNLVGEMPEYLTTSGGLAADPPVAETTLSHFSFPAGLHAHVFVSWVHPHKDQRLVVVGEEGMVIFDDVLTGENKLRFYPHAVDWRDGVPAITREGVIPLPYATDEPLAAECAHFLDCLTTGKSPRSDIDEAMRVLSVLDACERSMATHQPVTL